MKWTSLIFPLILLMACKESVDIPTPAKKKLSTSDISFHWHLDSIDVEERTSYITHTITNNGADTLHQDWAIYYNQLMGGPHQETLPSAVKVKKMNGTFFSIEPSRDFAPLAPEESYSYKYSMGALIFRKSDAPSGVYVVQDDQALSLENVKLSGFSDETLAALPMQSAQGRYKDNQNASALTMMPFDMIVPSPVYVSDRGGQLILKNKITYSTIGELERESKWLKNLLSQSYTGSISESEGADIQLIIDKNYQDVEGAYNLLIDKQGIMIKAYHSSGIFNGISSLAQLISPAKYKNPDRTISLSYADIHDKPTYSYRGMMLDVSRHFHEVESVKKLLDGMALYKLNKLHFHLGDDEGWRLEIPDLPELTSVGGRRGHTLDEVKSGYLQAAYGSGPHPEPEYSYGSGWYTRDEYIEILKYANDRHIEVIPEFDMPGHARAAIVAMDARYDRYMAQGQKEKAEEYLLSDKDDQSEYNSAQGYGDNSMCVCLESTFTFVEKVLSEVVNMYEEAGAPLKVFHSGGDEVAYGSWQKSPVCQEFIKANSESVSHTDELQPYFTNRYKSIIAKYGLVTAGWEEFVLENSSEGHHGKVLNPKFLGEKMQPYVWNATWGWGREDMAYQLANAGYKTVMCNSAQLYFDMAYNMDPDESGLQWTGLVDTKNPFFLTPEDIYAMPDKRNNAGAPVDDDSFENHARLTEKGKRNILGIQGHLWSETIVNAEKIEYYTFPKLLGLSERAWNGKPHWPNVSDRDERWAMMQDDWNVFANKLGQRQLPLLDHIFGGIRYRVPLPGLQLNGDQLNTNIRYPGLVLKYTNDGTEPNQNSPSVTRSIPSKNAKVRAFSTNGRASRVSEL